MKVGSGQTLNVADGLTLTGSNGTGAGAVDLTGTSAALNFTTTETFDSAVVTIGNTSDYSSDLSAATAGATLTLGSGLTIDDAGYTGVLGGPGAIVNQGKIDAATQGGSFYIGSAGFTNQGTIAVTNGDVVEIGFDPNVGYIGGFAFANAAGGAITVGANSHLYMYAQNGGTLANAGTMTVNGAGAVLDIGSGVLTNTGTIALTAGTLEVDSTLKGGTIVATSSGAVSGGGTLDGVTVKGALVVTVRLGVLDGLTLTGSNGTGAGAVDLTGTSAALNFTTTETFDSAVVTIGNTSDYSSDLSAATAGATLTLGSGLTIDDAGDNGGLGGPGAIVNQGKIDAATNGGDFSIGSASFTNQGTIAVTNGDAVEIGVDPNVGYITGFTFANAAGGAITVGANSYLYMYAQNGGTLANAGTMTVNGARAVLDIGSGVLTNTGTIALTAGTLEVDSTLKGGTIVATSSGAVSGSGTLDGVTVKGALVVTGNLSVVDGLTVTGSNGTGAGAVDLTATQAALNFTTTETFDSAVVTIGNTTGYSSHLSAATASATLTLGSGLTINDAGYNGVLGGPGAIVNQGKIDAATNGGDFSIGSASFTNQGTIAVTNGDAVEIGVDPNVGYITGFTFANAAGGAITVGANSYLYMYAQNGGTLANAGTMTVNGAGAVLDIESGVLTNAGTMTASNGGQFKLQPTKFMNLSGTTLTGGTYEVDGNSIIELNPNVGIATDDATIILNGVKSAIQSAKGGNEVEIDATLATIGAGGALELLGGRSLATKAAFGNAGLLQLGGGTFTAASLTGAAGSRLLGYGAVAATIVNNGLIEASGGTLTLQKAVTGSGGFQIDAGATLSLGASVPATSGIVFNGAGAVLALAIPAGFGNTLSGLVVGDEIDLLKTAANGITLNGSNQLIVTNNGATVATLNLPGSPNVDFSTVTDGNGGTFVVVSADQAPVTTAPATLSANAGVAVALSGLGVTDGDAVAYDETTTVVLSDATGLLSATAAAGATVSGAGTTSLTLSGSLAAVNTELASLTYTGASSNAPLTDTIDVATNDGRGGGDDHKIAVTVDQPPAAILPASDIIVITGPLAPKPLAGLGVTDPDAVSLGQTITVTLTAAYGQLWATEGQTPIIGQTITLSGSLAAVNGYLANLAYSAQPTGAPLTDTITVSTNDGAGGSASQSFTVNLDQPPVTTVPGAQTVLTGNKLKITGIGVADGDAVAAGETITVVLTDKVGLLSATKAAGATLSGAGTTSLTVSGTLAGVDAELATLTYTGALTGKQVTFNDTISLATSDGRGGANTTTIGVKINHVPPVIVAPKALKELSGQTVSLSPLINVTDASPLSATGNFTVTLSDKYGVLAATAAAGATVTGAGTGKLTLAGGLAGIQAELATLTYTGGSTGSKSKLSDTLMINASDGQGGTAFRKTAITIDHLPPVTTVPGAEKVASGVLTAITGIGVADADPTAGSAKFTTVLSDKTGLLSATAAAGAKVAGNGTKTLTLTGSLAALNQELASVIYNGALTGHATSATDTITVKTSDGRGYGDSHAIGVTITPTGSARPNLALFVQYVAAGFGGNFGAGATPHFIPPMAQALDLAAGHR